MKIGLFFGTYNPVHVGHLVIANYMADFTDLDKVWLVVTPQNPFKAKKSMLKDYHRLMMVRIATEDNPKLEVSNIEFDMPKPSYTCDTLAHLTDRFPEHEFALIMGEDNLRTFHKWKNHDVILKNHDLYVYPRNLTEQERIEVDAIDKLGNDLHSHHRVKYFEDVPIMRISSSFIRKAIEDGKDTRYLLTEPVHRFVTEMHFYEN